jgi:hypothetical protein
MVLTAGHCAVPSPSTNNSTTFPTPNACDNWMTPTVVDRVQLRPEELQLDASPANPDCTLAMTEAGARGVHPNLLNARGVLGVVRGDNNLTTALQQTELMRLSEKIQTLSNAVIGEM